MTTARTVAPNHGGRANPRSRAAVANFNGRNAQVDAPATAVPVLCSRHTREIDTRPSAHFPAAPHSRAGFRAVLIGGASFSNAVSNAKCPMHGCPVGYRDNAGCCTRTWYTVASTPFARALLPKALAGTRWSAMTAPIQRSGIRDQTGVRETLPRVSSTAAACFKGMGSFRLASQTGDPYTTRPAAPFSISALVHAVIFAAYPFPNPSERIGARRHAV